VKLYFRFLAALFRAFRTRHRIELTGESVASFRVLPTDLDFNRHLNNARYLALMDIGRLYLFAELGILRPMLRLRWSPVVGAVMLRFRKGLDPWMRFTLHTRLLGWDEKWFYVEQSFRHGGGLHTYALIRLLFRGDGRSLAPEETLAGFGVASESPALPEICLRWRETLRSEHSDRSAGLRITA
jgi:acyl-CoA thioesterase FadM